MSTAKTAAPAAAADSASEAKPKLWLGASLPRGYVNVTDEIDVTNIDLLNSDNPARILLSEGAPDKSGKAKEQDWVESDTDEQLLLFLPFRSRMKVRSIHITSLQSEGVMRPRTLKVFSNQVHSLGFEEADSVEPTQTIEIASDAWDKTTNTANVELRFVKFQNVTSLLLYVVDGDGDEEKVRIDRIRVIGETGDRRDLPEWKSLTKEEEE